MKAIRLIAVADCFSDKPGFMVKGTPDRDDFMADRDGLLIAHDLIEHQNGPGLIGYVWDELEAMGGVWHVRGRWGDMRQTHMSVYTPEQNVAADIVRMFPEWINEKGPRAPRTRASLYDDDFRDILEIARADIPSEHDYLLHKELSPGNTYLDDYLAEALARMRIGFRKAERRFGRHDRFASNRQFAAIQDAVKEAVNWIDFEGQEFVLCYGRGEATLRPGGV